jgi:hypothetical protein
MNEDFLHFLWKNGLYQASLTEVKTGEPIEVINPGQHNQDQGPDFFNARIKIGNTLWAGNVEIHLKASDWLKHKHQNDKNYDTVILHVVGQNDMEIIRSDGNPIPSTEIKCPKELLEKYLFLMQNHQWMPCQTFIKRIDQFIFVQWLETLMIERLNNKILFIDERFKGTKHHWEETFYQVMAFAFGFKTNAPPFLMLAQSLPLSVLAKHKNQLLQIEALLFGQAGLLPIEPVDNYSTLLVREYRHLAHKYQLTPLSGQLWKFAKMRPGNFPTIRLAQFAALIYQSSALMSKVMECKKTDDIRTLFQLKTSEYWEQHYQFGKPSDKKIKTFGDEAFHLITINSVIPFMFFYGKMLGKPDISERAVEWLEQLPSEKNHIINNWAGEGINARNALESQALIELTNNYCKHKRCLNCRVGNQVMVHRF